MKKATRICRDCSKEFSFIFNRGPGFRYCEKCDKDHVPGKRRKNYAGSKPAKYVHDMKKSDE